MKVLITGATGFLGKRLSEVLHAANYEVVATGRNAQIGAALQNQGINFIAGDLNNSDFANKICHRCDAVIHCAALSTVWSAYDRFYQANVLAVKHLISAAKKQKIRRFIHVSTPSIYVGAPLKENITETTPLPQQFANDYAQTKKMSEDIVLDATEYSFHTTIIRPQGIFGPGDSTIMPRLLMASDDGGIPLIKGGQHKIDLTYIDNVCQALMLSLTSGSNGGIYNISNGEPIIFLDFLQKIFASIKHPLRCKVRPYWLLKLVANLYEKTYKALSVSSEPRLTNYTLSILSESRTLNINAAQKELGYKPVISLDEGIYRYAQWYIQQHQLKTNIHHQNDRIH